MRRRTVDTIIELKDFSARDTVRVLGYHTPYDHGGGMFRWDANSTETDNGGTIIESNTMGTTGRWKRIFSGKIHVNWFGTYSDSIKDSETNIWSGTDDSPFIRATIDFARDNGYSDIYFDNVGTFMVNKVELHPGLNIDLGGSTLVRPSWESPLTLLNCQVEDPIDSGTFRDGTIDDAGCECEGPDPDSDSGTIATFSRSGDSYKTWNRMFTTRAWSVTPQNKLLDGNGDPVLDDMGQFVDVYSYPNVDDSALLSISNGILDGNMLGQEVAECCVNHEHDALVFLTGAGKTEKLKICINHVVFRDCLAADGIEQRLNTDLSVSNCFFENCERGSITFTGVGAKLRFNNISCGGDVYSSQLHVEIEEAVDSSDAVYIEGSNAEFEHGCSIAVSPGSEVLLNNIRCNGGSFTLGSLESKTMISNSIFRIGVKTDNTNRIVNPGNTVFNHCRFIITDEGADPSLTTPPPDICSEYFNADLLIAGVRIHWRTADHLPRMNQRVTFNHCVWEAEDDLTSASSTTTFLAPITVQEVTDAAGDGAIDPTADAATTYKKVAVYCEPDDISSNNEVLIHGGSVSNAYDTAFRMYHGGRMSVSGGVRIHANTAFHAYGTSLDVLITCDENGKNCVVTDIKEFRWILDIGDIVLGEDVSTYAKLIASVPCTIIHRGTFILNSDQNIFATCPNHGLVNAEGYRLIMGDKAPESGDHALMGDIWRLKVPVPGTGTGYEWVATGQTSLDTTLVPADAVWTPKTTLP